MMTKAEAIERIEQHSYCDADDYEYIFMGPLMRILNELEVLEWIPVDVALPDDKQECLVTHRLFNGAYICSVATYSTDLYSIDEYDFPECKGKSGWYDFDSEWGFYSLSNVTAWMPAPEPYKGEQE